MKTAVLIGRFQPLRFAMKASAVTVDGIEREVCKTPVTDMGKRSKRSRQILVESDHTYKTFPLRNERDLKYDCLQEVFRDGKLLIDQNLQEIRVRASL